LINSLIIKQNNLIKLYKLNFYKKLFSTFRHCQGPAPAGWHHTRFKAVSNDPQPKQQQQQQQLQQHGAKLISISEIPES